jgi:hypothetical protein
MAAVDARRSANDVATLLKDLPTTPKARVWIRARSDEATRPILAFETIKDAIRPEPWIVSDALLDGHTQTVSDALLLEAVAGTGAPKLQWMSLSDAMTSRDWARSSERQPFDAMFGHLLDSLEGHVRAAGEAEVLGIGLPHPPVTKRTTCERCGRPTHPGRPCRL